MRASLISKRPFVRVGSELEDPELARVSLVGAPYGLQHRNLGTVNLLGPLRMDYVKAIDAVRSAARELISILQRAPLDGLASGPALAAQAQALIEVVT